jgi:hypothetical protein
MSTPLSVLFLILLAQISTPGPQINRQEDLRKQTEESVNKRAEADRRFLDVRSTQAFQANVTSLLNLFQETCTLRAGSTTADRAKKMDGLIGQVLWYIDLKQKAPKIAATDPADALDVFCTEAAQARPNLDKLLENSKARRRDPALESASHGQLQALQQHAKPLRKLR